MKNKITVVGAGFVGTTCASKLMDEGLGDVVLLDIVENLAQGKALDIMQSAPLKGYQTTLTGTDKYVDTKGSDLIVITAGLSRKPGMSRDDLLTFNAKVMQDVTIKLCKYSENPIIIVVTNPLDIMTYVVQKISKLPYKRVFGMAGVLDSTRYSYFIAEYLNVAPSQVRSMVLGGHGNSMVPLPRLSTVNGVPVSELISEEDLKKISKRTQNGGAEIVSLLKTGSAYYAPATSVVEMCRSVLYNSRVLLPCSVHLSGEYGIQDVYCGVPVMIGREGIDKILEINLLESELVQLRESAQSVKTTTEKLSL